jgi:D-lactate dehydrogenase (cytochrome)
MDCIDLLIGSEGTLALFYEIGIVLSPAPEIVAGLSFFPARPDAFAFASFLRSRTPVCAIEYFDHTALSLLDSLREDSSLNIPQFPIVDGCAVYWEHVENPGQNFEDEMEEWEMSLVEHNSSFDRTWSGFEPKEIERLKTFRHAVPEAINTKIAHLQHSCPQIRKIGTDAAFDTNTFETAFNRQIQLLENQGIEHVCFGHLGDFHLHINMIPHTGDDLDRALALYGELMEITVESNGTISAEHGIGKLKTKYLERMYGKEKMDAMKRVKTAFDPDWLLNRGNIFAIEG